MKLCRLSLSKKLIKQKNMVRNNKKLVFLYKKVKGNGNGKQVFKQLIYNDQEDLKV